MEYGSSGFGGYRDLFESRVRLNERFARLDLDAREVTFETRRLLKMPFLAVLDTSFFHSAFKYQLAHDGAVPLSLQAAQQAAITLFMAEETVWQLFDKIPEFAESLNTTAVTLESLFAKAWAPWITSVDLSSMPADARAQVVLDRDPTDRPAATLATLLSPCLLLATDKDFESLAPVESWTPGELPSAVVAVSTTLVVGQATVRVNATVMVPVLPVAVVGGGVCWLGGRLGVSPWLLAAAIVGGGAFLYMRLDAERRAAARKALADVGTTLLEELVRAQAAQQAALRDLEHRVVPYLGPRSVEAVVLRELAVAGEAISAQRLWERLDPATRPSVTRVRALLRGDPAVALAGRGVWTLGVPLDWLLGHYEDWLATDGAVAR